MLLSLPFCLFLCLLYLSYDQPQDIANDAAAKRQQEQKGGNQEVNLAIESHSLPSHLSQHPSG